MESLIGYKALSIIDGKLFSFNTKIKDDKFRIEYQVGMPTYGINDTPLFLWNSVWAALVTARYPLNYPKVVYKCSYIPYRGIIPHRISIDPSITISDIAHFWQNPYHSRYNDILYSDSTSHMTFASTITLLEEIK